MEADASVMAGDGAFGAVGAAAGRTHALPTRARWPFLPAACRSVRSLPRSATAGARPERLQVAPLPSAEQAASANRRRTGLQPAQPGLHTTQAWAARPPWRARWRRRAASRCRPGACGRCCWQVTARGAGRARAAWLRPPPRSRPSRHVRSHNCEPRPRISTCSAKWVPVQWQGSCGPSVWSSGKHGVACSLPVPAHACGSGRSRTRRCAAGGATSGWRSPPPLRLWVPPRLPQPCVRTRRARAPARAEGRTARAAPKRLMRRPRASCGVCRPGRPAAAATAAGAGAPSARCMTQWAPSVSGRRARRSSRPLCLLRQHVNAPSSFEVAQQTQRLPNYSCSCDHPAPGAWRRQTCGWVPHALTRARASAGAVAAAVSSGGIALKAPGRVGEAALFGAGCWAADPAPDRRALPCACSASLRQPRQ